MPFVLAFWNVVAVVGWRKQYKMIKDEADGKAKIDGSKHMPLVEFGQRKKNTPFEYHTKVNERR